MIKTKLIAMLVVGALVLNMPVAAYASANNEEILNSVDEAVEYLENSQNDDGSISGFGGESQWAVVAVESAGTDADKIVSDKDKSLEDFVSNDHPDASAPATDIERRMLAINALGEDTSDFNGVNYNAKLLAQENNNQFGDESLLNDDYFGILAASVTKDDSFNGLVEGSLDHIISNQETDGGFSYTTNDCAWCGSDSNDTAAAIMAMYAAEGMDVTHILLDTSRDRAVVYLLSTQNEDGGFGYDIYSPSDGSSTAWALMALNVIGDPVRNEAVKARDWLLSIQNEDGGFGYYAYGFTDSDTYTTSHAIIALLGSSWTLDPAPLTADIEEKNEEFAVVTIDQAQEALSNFAAINSPVQSAEETNEQVSVTNKIATINEDAAVESSQDNLPYLGLSVLGTIALAWFGWFMLSSKRKQEV